MRVLLVILVFAGCSDSPSVEAGDRFDRQCELRARRLAKEAKRNGIQHCSKPAADGTMVCRPKTADEFYRECAGR